MLFNTAWNKNPEVQPQSDLLSTASLVAWLEKQPVNKIYDYNLPYGCLLARYFREHGHHNPCLGPKYVHCLNGYDGPVVLPPAFHAAATYRPHTYGDALKRAKAYL